MPSNEDTAQPEKKGTNKAERGGLRRRRRPMPSNEDTAQPDKKKKKEPTKQSRVDKGEEGGSRKALFRFELNYICLVFLMHQT